MGLPRYLAEKFNQEFSTWDGWDLALQAGCAGATMGNRLYEIHNPKDGKKRPPAHHVTLSLVKWRWRAFKLRKYKKDCVDSLTRVRKQFYVGLVQRQYGGNIAEYREVMVSTLCLQRLEERNKLCEARDVAAAALQAEIIKYKGKVYASRLFPPKLKAIIYERDNYCCRHCLRGRAVLEQLGLHLECDHIKAFEDGGLTSYENGQTLCSECNTAKHHAKRFFRQKEHLRLA